MKILIFFLLQVIISAKSQNINTIKLPLVNFLRKLSPNNPLDWNAASNPCLDGWRGISCNNRSASLRSIDLKSLNLSGSIDGELLYIICNSSSLTVLDLNSNSLTGELPPEISYCYDLTKLFLGNNRLSGSLPSSIPNLRNLKKLDISNNNFSGDLPSNLSEISGLDTFLANQNSFTGAIPDFDLNYFDKFNVSFNQLSGSLPLNSAKFASSSFEGNYGLCGKPLDVSCPPPSSSVSESKTNSVNKLVLILGYVLFGLSLVLLLLYYMRKKKKGVITPKRESRGKKLLDNNEKESNLRSEYSISSSPSAAAAGQSVSLIVLSKDEGKKDLRFKDLLRAPAELMRKGRFGNLYKVVIDGGETELVVKRIKDSSLTGEEFQRKIMRMDQARHPNVLPVIALYCSEQEKLVVYEYQQNGSLFNLLHGDGNKASLKWADRLNIAASVSAGLSYMHQNLRTGHGSLKSSNILFSSSMQPLISEYGLTALSTTTAADDVYALGLIMLEMLTGKQSHGCDLVRWVGSVSRDEWREEVFDTKLLADGEDGKEEEMVGLLQVALRCVSSSSRRPTMPEVAAFVDAVKEY